MAPTECCAKRSVEHLPRIKHQALSLNQLCKSEDVEISLSQSLFHIETQFGVDWAEPGFGTRAYMDCSTSHSEGGALQNGPLQPPWGANGGGKKNCSKSQPQLINNGLELTSDNPFGHPYNLEENLLNNKSAGWFSDEHTIRSHSALEVSICVAYAWQTSRPRR